MKLYFPLLDKPFDICDDKVNQIVIESPAELYKFLTCLYGQMNKDDGDIVLSEDCQTMDISRALDITTDYFPFEINKKALVTKLCANLKELAIKEKLQATYELTTLISNYISDLIDVSDFDIDYDEPDTSAIFKLLNVRFCDDSVSLEERILDYCKNTVALCGEKIFMFVSLRNYLSADAYENFKRMIVDRKIRVILVEAMEYPKQALENTVIIDEDGCTIMC